MPSMNYNGTMNNNLTSAPNHDESLTDEERLEAQQLMLMNQGDPSIGMIP